MKRPQPSAQPSPDAFDTEVVQKADDVVAGAVKSFVSSAGRDRAIVVTAPAGAGKSGLVCRAVGSCRRAGMRVAVASPTNEQAYGLVDRISSEHPNLQISFFPSQQAALPQQIAGRSNVAIVNAGGANAAEVVVATLAKLGDASCRGTLQAFDGMLVDESYQADAGQYYSVGHLARTHLLVGDGGQLSPFSTLKDSDHWRGLAEDPLQTAVGLLLRHHSQTPVFKLPITRRLDTRAVPMVRAFYPSIEFDAAVKPGTRQMRLDAVKRRDKIDSIVEQAATDGWGYYVLPHSLTISADPEIIQWIVDLTGRIQARQAQVRCERHTTWTSPRIAVAVSHNDQKDQTRAALHAAGRTNIAVDTANRLQGLEFDLVIAWHPLAGLAEADEFHLDPGRLCVLLTRHRHACIVIGRAGDRELVAGIPPRSPSYIGVDHEPVLDGWAAHEDVFAQLARFSVEA